MATATKKKTTTKKKEAVEKVEKDQIDEDIEVFESVALHVPRTLVHPETGEERMFSQHELGFIPKTKFFRLLSGTLRLASEGNVGVQSLISQVFGDETEDIDNETMITGILRLVELSPDFLEETFIYALNVKPKDREFVWECLDTIEDDEGMEILEVFIAQNGEPIRDFLTRKLPRLGKRLATLTPNQES